MSTAAGSTKTPQSTQPPREPQTSREAILERVRAGLRDVPDVSPAADVPIPWEYGRVTEMADIFDRFEETVVDYRATVVRCSPDEVADRVAAAFVEAGVRSIVVPPGVPDDWRRAVAHAGVEIHADGVEPLSRRALDSIGGVATGAAVGIAETGTIVLDHDTDQGRRALTLIPDMHVCVVRADQIVSDVPEGVARLEPAVRAGRPMTWISGPSATSDIELDRVEGVHGPRTLYVILAS